MEQEHTKSISRFVIVGTTSGVKCLIVLITETMEDNNRRPNAALINREWFEAAVKTLTADGISHVLLAACNYVFYNEIRVRLDDFERCVFAMITPALESDIVKYRERCARNAANAKSKRVGASGCEWERVGANTTKTSTPTPTTTSTTTTTRSLSPIEVEEREKWLIYGYFWSIGSNAIKEESSAFWNYYESLGWKNNKGAAIKDKLAAARMWRRQYDTKQPKNGADAWYMAVKTCEICDYNLWNAYAGAERDGDKAIVRLRVPEAWVDDFRSKCGNILLLLQKAWRVQEIAIEGLS